MSVLGWVTVLLVVVAAASIALAAALHQTRRPATAASSAAMIPPPSAARATGTSVCGQRILDSHGTTLGWRNPYHKEQNQRTCQHSVPWD
jgi:hypothetical protein